MAANMVMRSACEKFVQPRECDVHLDAQMTSSTCNPINSAICSDWVRSSRRARSSDCANGVLMRKGRTWSSNVESSMAKKDDAVA
jgi:hypothetical protein